KNRTRTLSALATTLLAGFSIGRSPFQAEKTEPITMFMQCVKSTSNNAILGKESSRLCPGPTIYSGPLTVKCTPDDLAKLNLYGEPVIVFSPEEQVAEQESQRRYGQRKGTSLCQTSHPSTSLQARSGLQ